ncbi:AbiH family protein [Maribacter sp. M208]|uniref:AbiH family protein n=1 Tax=Maribacter huludaoensis TaxID=3030010 RepID=UPI0023EC9451|nr:AbiH family protein [Maribacter huludaoensis]MDF4223249.1 AbiH family protein [Maribacter huludaoensis]
MKIIYLLGNGFDVNLKLQTKYTDFYKHYRKVVSEKEVISKIKKNIESENTWADLESALGQYTSQVNSIAEFIEIFEDIGDNLAEYLRDQEEKIEALKINKEKFYGYLSFPENSLPVAQKNKVTAIRNKWANHQWETHVITFNYTKTFEKLIGENIKALQLGNHHNAKIFYRGIQHVHGFIDDSMVMGVNDISQIKNELFHNETELTSAFIKSDCNQAMQHTIDEQCKKHISSANLICIYGSSLGITDKIWWESIGERLKSDCYLIIFSYSNEKISRRRDYKKKSLRHEIKTSFLQKTNLTEQEKEKAYSKIFVGINSDLFNIIQNEDKK